MKKVNVDVKNGQFIIYPSGEALSTLEGYISKSYYKQVGNSTQLKVVLINENVEYTLNCMINNVTYQSLVTCLIEKIEPKVILSLEKKSNEFRDFYIFKLT